MLIRFFCFFLIYQYRSDSRFSTTSLFFTTSFCLLHPVNCTETARESGLLHLLPKRRHSIHSAASLWFCFFVVVVFVVVVILCLLSARFGCLRFSFFKEYTAFFVVVLVSTKHRKAEASFFFFFVPLDVTFSFFFFFCIVPLSTFTALQAFTYFSGSRVEVHF